MNPDVNSGPSVTIVLPHRERFSPEAAGAVAMVVKGLATGGSRYRATVVGPALSGPCFPGVDFIPVRAPRWLPLSGSQQYIVALIAVLARRPPGLIEVHNKPEIAAWLARIFPRRPVVLFLHNDPRTMRGADSPRARRRLLERLARVVTVSETVRGWYMERIGNIPARRDPVVIHNALDAAALPPCLPPAQRDHRMLFAGRVVPDKAPDAFVAACALALPRLPGWRADIIGTDGFSADIKDSAFIKALRPQAAAAGVGMLGYQTHPAVLAALSRAAIAVVPSRWAEPFGLAALEALACGAALLCSMRGGLAEIVGEAGVAIDPDDIEGLADALVRLATDAEARARLAGCGQERALQRFSLADAIRRLDDLRALLSPTGSSLL